MKTKTNHQSFQKTLDIAVILLMLFSQFGWAVGNVAADEGTTPDMLGMVNVNVTPEGQWIQANNLADTWPAGTEITLTIDDPHTPQPADYSNILTMGPSFWDPDVIVAFFDLNNQYTLQTDDIVTVTGGTTTVTLPVTDFHATGVDVVADAVSGWATPGSSVGVCANTPSGCEWRHVTADGVTGEWIANFATTGPQPDEQQIVDIKPSDNGFALEYSSGTVGLLQYDWRVPNPNFSVRVQPNDFIEGLEWPLGETVTLWIDDHGTTNNPDYSETQEVGEAPWDPNQTYVAFDLNGKFDLQPGYEVTLTGGGYVQSHIVTRLAFTEINVDTDIVTGTATPYAQVDVWACNGSDPCPDRHVTADEDGNWSVNFGIPDGGGEEPATIDLRNGTWVDSQEWDVDHLNRTMYGKSVPNPNFSVRTQYGDQVEAFEWPLGSTLTLEIDNPSNGPGTDYSTNRVVFVAPWDSNQTYVSFDLWNVYDIQPNDVVSVSNGTVIKTTIVTSLAFTDIDVDADIVSGMASPGARIDIWACDAVNCINRHVNADNNGNWIADFAHTGVEGDEQNTFDIVGGTWIDSQENDEDGDRTMFGQNVPNPHIEVEAWNNRVTGYEWPSDTEITIAVDDPGTLDSPDYQSTQTADWSGWVEFWPPLDIVPDFVVTMTDGTTTKVLSVSALHGFADESANLVYGIATPETQLSFWIEGTNINSQVGVDAGGNWSVDLNGLYTLKTWTFGGVSEPDADGDVTYHRWRVVHPTIEAWLHENMLKIWDWPLGAELNISVDDPSTPVSPDYETQQIVEDNPYFEGAWAGIEIGDAFRLAPSMQLTVSGGGVTDYLTITAVDITAVDTENDIVRGISDPGITVNVWDWSGTSYYVVADDQGNWFADFSIPDDNGRTTDLAPGMDVLAFIRDDDSDSTGVAWHIGDPFPCQPGTTISGYVLTAIGTTTDNAWVFFDDYNTNETLFYTNNVDENGHYSCYLPEGDYRVRAHSGDYSTEYFEDTIFEDAALIHASSTTELTGVNFTLDIPYGAIEQFTFNFNDPILSELAVRQAIAYGTDRAHIIAAQEDALPFTINSYVSSQYWAYPVSGLPQYDYNPGLAAEILTSAGWIDTDGDGVREKNGVRLHFTYLFRENAPWRFVTADIFAENMAAIGAEVEILPLPQPEFMQRVFTDHDFGIAQFGWVGVNGSSDQGYGNFLGWIYYSANGSNAGSYNNPVADQLLEDALAFNTRAELLPYYQQHQILVMSDLAVFPLYMVDYTDMDEDSISDMLDNARFVFNPDQRDVDSDGTADVLDPCPADNTNTCNTAGSTAGVIGPTGGTLTTSDTMASLYIQPGAVDESLSFSITYMGAGYQIVIPGSNDYKVIGSYSVQPHGTQFDVPTTLTLKWEDEDNDGIVDGTTYPETEIRLIKDGVEFGGQPCNLNLNCDMVNNTLTATLTSLSLFELAVPENHPPILLTITAPVDPRQVNTTVNTMATFLDDDPGDTHTVVWDWGDGTTSPGTVNEAAKTIAGSHAYATAGVYTVKVTLTDTAGATAELAYNYIVVYDPSAGFVTGGGWIETQPGFYPSNPSLTGKANFGFEIKYQQGASAPSGTLEFHFKPGDLKLKASAFEWLIVDGAKAIARGSGTVNGQGNYGFVLSVIDDSPDLFRIKIWDKVTGQVIYDNMPGAGDLSDPTAAINGGSVVIHK